MMKEISENSFKKKICSIYNEVNCEVFGYGASSLKVEMQEKTIHLLGKHQPVQVLVAMEAFDPAVKREIDSSILVLFKKKLIEKLEQGMGITPDAILKDYDQATQWVSTSIILKDNLEEKV